MDNLKNLKKQLEALRNQLLEAIDNNDLDLADDISTEIIAYEEEIQFCEKGQPDRHLPDSLDLRIEAVEEDAHDASQMGDHDLHDAIMLDSYDMWSSPHASSNC